MAVEVLSPKDCLKDSLSRQSVTNFNPNPNPSCLGRPSRPQSDGKNRRPNRPNNLPRPVQKLPAPQNLVMGQVKILKRAEEIPKTAPAPRLQKQNFKPQVPAPPPQKQNPKPQAPDLGNTNRMGPESKRVPKLSKHADPYRTAGFYAGSSSCTSELSASAVLFRQEGRCHKHRCCGKRAAEASAAEFVVGPASPMGRRSSSRPPNCSVSYWILA